MVSFDDKDEEIEPAIYTRQTSGHSVHFEMPDDSRWAAANVPSRQNVSVVSVNTAPGAPPEQHRRQSITGLTSLHKQGNASFDHMTAKRGTTFGAVSKRRALREIFQERKKEYKRGMGWEHYNPISSRSAFSGNSAPSSITTGSDTTVLLEDGKARHSYDGSRRGKRISTMTTDAIAEDAPPEEHAENPRLISQMSSDDWSDDGEKSKEALIAMFTENRINVLMVMIPVAWWSHQYHWPDSWVFILNFLAMVPLASMLGIFTEELAAHTNDVVGGLINATFGNAVELVVAIQALLAEDYRVVQASLVGSVFSNLLLVLGMCFFCGGLKFTEQTFVAQGAVASIALLGLSGLTLLLPQFFGGEDGDGDGQGDSELTVSRIGAAVLILMYAQLLFFQLNTHGHLFEGDDDVQALIPFSWALSGLVIITLMVTVLSEWLVGSIDGFCEDFNIGRSFVGVVILPVVGNAVEHISAVTVAMKNKMDLALGVALGSAVQIALFVLPSVVIIGSFTGKTMSLKFPATEVYLYIMSVFIVALCLSNERSNWLEGSLLVFAYVLVSVGIWFEDTPEGP